MELPMAIERRVANPRITKAFGTRQQREHGREVTPGIGSRRPLRMTDDGQSGQARAGKGRCNPSSMYVPSG